MSMTREEAINAITQFIENYAYGNDLIGLKMAIETLKKERPHGEWIQDFTMDTSTICSKCGEKAWYKEYSGWVTESNFCPNCGADMRKKEGETETWNGFHGQLEVPKGTFDKIWNDEEGEAE